MKKNQTWVVIGSLLVSLASATALQAPLQDLGASVTPQGLLIHSTSEEEGKSSFRLTPLAVGRGAHPQAIGNGQVSQEGEYLLLNRGILTERVSANMDGVRQDFILSSRPQGTGTLNLVLEVLGAEVKARQDGTVGLILEGGRELRYHRLIVTDALGARYEAKMVAMQNHSIHIEVQDAGATYPLTIDPTVADADWLAMNPGIPGTSGEVNVVHFDRSSGLLYVAGGFKAAGGAVALGLAQWNGSSWKAIGGSDISSMLSDGKGNLYVAGNFRNFAGFVANGIAKWDGAKWSPLGTGISNYNIASLALDSSGNLYAGTNYGNVKKWDGKAWIDLPSLGSRSTDKVQALACDKAGNVYAGGTFLKQGGSLPTTVAKWNGSAWSEMGSGLDATVKEMGFDSKGNLYAMGDFQNSGSTPLAYIAKWSGTQWSALGAGLANSLKTMAVSPNGDIYVKGRGVYLNGYTSFYIDKWNGSTWSELPGAVVGYGINSLTTDGQGNVFAGGLFEVADGVGANNVAQWGAGKCVGLGVGISRYVNCVLADANGNLYVGGAFRQVGSVSAEFIAKWNGSTWSKLGTGVDGLVEALALDSKGNLYAGGWFSNAGGIAAEGVAKWDGKAWVALGSGLDGVVSTLLVDSKDNVYAGGWFSKSGTTSMQRVAKWDGATWNSLGTGMNSGNVQALAFDGQGGLYAAGFFTNAGGVDVKNIALWNGSTWSALGDGLDKSVEALVFDGKGTLYAGGSFSKSGTVNTGALAKWNGSEWGPIADRISPMGTVNTMVMDAEGVLYTGGGVPGGTSGDVTDLYAFTSYAYRWDGVDFSQIGTFSDEVKSLTVTNKGDLIAGGDFIVERSQGLVYSPYLMRFGDPATGAIRKFQVKAQDLNVKAGRLFVGQYEGSVQIRRLDGSLVNTFQVNRQSSYALPLGAGAYILEAGATKLRFNKE